MEVSGNQVKIKGNNIREKVLEVSIIEKEGEEATKTKRFMDVKMDKHEVLLTPKFQ
jgi:hypothetical protein